MVQPNGVGFFAGISSTPGCAMVCNVMAAATIKGAAIRKTTWKASFGFFSA